MTRQQYRRRRVVALAALIVVVLAVYAIGAALFGDDTDTRLEAAPQDVAATAPVIDEGGSTEVPTPTIDGDATAETQRATVEATTTVPRTTTSGVPSSDNPAKMLIAGDSDAGAFAPYLERLIDETDLVTTVLDYKVSSGLARPDFFDWPAHFTSTLPEVDPSIVVVTFGGNDSQGLTNGSGTFVAQQPRGGSGNDADWRAQYGQRVGAVMDQLTAGGRTLIWVGIPNDDNPDVTARLQVQNEVVVAEVARRPGVIFIDTWNRFSGRNGGWAEFVIDPRDGEGKAVRRDDGFHLNETGAEILALDIAEAIKAVLRSRGAEI